MICSVGFSEKYSSPLAVFSGLFFLLFFFRFFGDVVGDSLIFGSAAYLLTVAGFVVFGHRSKPYSAWIQVSTALAVGVPVGLCVDVYSNSKEHLVGEVQLVCETQGGASKSNVAQPFNFLCRPLSVATRKADAVKEVASENPLEKINVFAAVLAVALAVLTLVAQKAASEARHEADQAAIRVRESERRAYLQNLLAFFLLEAQRIKNEEVSNLDKYASVESAAPELAGLHMRWAEVLNALNNLLVDLLHSVTEDRFDELNVSVNSVEVHVKGLAKAHRGYATSASIELLQDQSRRYVAPLRQLLQRSVDVLGGGAFDGITAENVRKLAKVLRRLNRILRELG
jgi:hypothetical protein